MTAPPQINQGGAGLKGGAGHPSPAPGLLDLPPDVIQSICLQLSLKDRLAVQRTCSALRGTYEASSVLGYDLVLRTSGYLDHPRSLTPPAELDDGETDPSTRDASTSFMHELRAQEAGPSSASSLTWAPTPQVESPTHRPSTEVYEGNVHETVKVPRWSHVEPLIRSEEQGKTLAPARKLDLLRDREARWDRLEPRAKRRMTVQGPPGVYELQEGIFLICDDWEEDDAGKPRSIRLIPLPSSVDPQLDDPPIPLKEVKLPFSIADLTMDPTQDLIVVAEHQAPDLQTGQSLGHRYHLLSLSTARPHPLAQMPILEFPGAFGRHLRSRQLLQIMGDVLIIMVTRIGTGFWPPGAAFPPFLMHLNLGPAMNEEEVVAWNWRTGKVLMRKLLPDSGWYASMALLSPTLFLVTSTSDFSRPVSMSHSIQERGSPAYFPPVIKIYSFLHGEENERSPIQPLPLDHNDDTTPRPILLAQLEMPSMESEVVMSNFDVRPDPAFPVRSTSDQSPRTGRAPQFTQDPSKGLLVFDFSIIEPSAQEMQFDAQAMLQNVINRTTDYELFVLRETLLQLGLEGEERFRQVRVGAEAGYEHWRVERVIPWRDWGERGARLMYAAMDRRQWVCSCSGYRFAALLEADEVGTAEHGRDQTGGGVVLPAKRSRVKIYDFSPYGVRREIIKEGLDMDVLSTRYQDVAELMSTYEEVGQKDADDDHQRRLDELDVENTILEMAQANGGVLPRDARYRRYDYWVTDRSEYDGLAPGDQTYAAAEGGHADMDGNGESSSADTPMRDASDSMETGDEDKEVPGKQCLILEPSIIPRGETWTEDVISWLPYRSIISEDTVLANGIMIDNERIMIVDSQHSPNGDWTKTQQEIQTWCM